MQSFTKLDAFDKTKKIKTQLITTIDSVVQKEPNQTLIYINILMHIQNPK
jgi:hypothetical protein